MSEPGNLLPQLYGADHEGGWTQGMRKVSHAILADAWLQDGPLLEVGCGSGVFARELAARHAGRSVTATDLRPTAMQVASAHRRVLHLAQADLLTLPFDAGTFALAIALDVVDQHGLFLETALHELCRVLCRGGWLLVRVSAYPWLQGVHDLAFNTGRRYWRAEIVESCRRAGFAVARATYANTLLAPPIVLMRLLQRWGVLPYRPLVDADNLANRLAQWALAREARWLRRRNLPFGISLYVLAVK